MVPWWRSMRLEGNLKSPCAVVMFKASRGESWVFLCRGDAPGVRRGVRAGADSALGELQLCTVWGASQTHSRAPAVTGRQTLKQANSEVSWPQMTSDRTRMPLIPPQPEPAETAGAPRWQQRATAGASVHLPEGGWSLGAPHQTKTWCTWCESQLSTALRGEVPKNDA